MDLPLVPAAPDHSPLLQSRVKVYGPALAAGLLAMVFALSAPRLLQATDLEPRTLEAFERYAQAVEARAVPQVGNDPAPFLYIDTLPAAERRQAWATIQGGEVWVGSPWARNSPGRPPRVPDGLITHWVGAVFMPGVSLSQVVAVLQDYDHHKDIYNPQVVRSRLVSREGNDFKSFIRVRDKTPWVTVTLNINSETLYTPLGAARIVTRTHSTRLAQVEAADTPREREFSPGHDSGYLWRFNTYWRLEARQGGVVAEWESITLSRDIPWLLRWAVRPFVERLARSTVDNTLASTRRAAQSRKLATP